MASFDFIESASGGYRFFWEERETLLRMGAIPVVIKVVTYLVITALAMDGNPLRQGLFLLPSFFAEGWLVAQAIRMAVLGERWPVALSGDPRQDSDTIMKRSRGILSGMIVYVLIKMVLTFVTGYVKFAETQQPAPMPPAEPTAMTYAAAVFILVTFIWLFRMLWLYVPATLDYPMQDFVKRFKSFMVSVHMIGAWLLCFIPMAMAMTLISQILHGIFPGSGDVPAAGYTYGVALVQSIMEVVIAVISSVAMAYGVHSLYKGVKHDSYH